MHASLVRQKRWSTVRVRLHMCPFVCAQGALLSSANLANARLSFASCVGADLCGANLQGAELVAADLTDARLARANLRASDLTSARLVCADMEEADATGASLRGANMCNAVLTRACFNEANLHAADLRGAQMQRAHFARADLSAACMQPFCEPKPLPTTEPLPTSSAAMTGAANLRLSDHPGTATWHETAQLVRGSRVETTSNVNATLAAFAQIGNAAQQAAAAELRRPFASMPCNRGAPESAYVDPVANPVVRGLLGRMNDPNDPAVREGLYRLVRNKDGILTRDDVRRALAELVHTLGLPLTAMDLDAVIRALDANHDGKRDYLELLMKHRVQTAAAQLYSTRGTSGSPHVEPLLLEPHVRLANQTQSAWADKPNVTQVRQWQPPVWRPVP